MTQAAHPVGQHPGERQIRLITRQAQGQRAKGLGHGRTVDNRQHRHAEVTCQVGARRGAVEQPHHPFDEDQVGFTCRLPEQPAAFLGTDHPQVQLADGGIAGAFENHGVEKVRPAFEHPHLAAQIAVQARQRGSDRGLALARSRRGNQDGGAMAGLAHSSTPFWARIPAWKACLSMPISVTVSASSTISGLAARPVTMTCCMGGRAWMSDSTWSRSR